ncbi:MAG: NADH-quinone oxidoreductase subunit D [Bdellovibrionota bacterium]
MRSPHFESLKTDLTRWEIGPYHSALPAPMRLSLELDGEIIVDTSIETGFLHRGLEKSFELHLWRSAIAYADHLDPESAVFGELALCLAVEEIGGIVVPPRAQMIRILLSELTRMSAHLNYIVRMANAVGSDTIIHYVLRDRERILDLFELLTGARFSLNFLRFGGVSADITEGFIERVLDVCELIRIRLKEYNDLFTFNQAFLKRTAGVGVLEPRQVFRLGITGPNARASGSTLDIRKDSESLGYLKLDFHVPTGKGEGGVLGDAHDRFLLRLREVAQSMEILKQAAETVMPGRFIAEAISPDYLVPAGEGFSRVESPRGLLGCHVVSDGGRYPARVQFRPPTLASLSVIPDLLMGARIEDLPVILASMDLGIAEADR